MSVGWDGMGLLGRGGIWWGWVGFRWGWRGNGWVVMVGEVEGRGGGYIWDGVRLQQEEEASPSPHIYRNLLSVARDGLFHPAPARLHTTERAWIARDGMGWKSWRIGVQ